jgi:hypothetical protein
VEFGFELGVCQWAEHHWPPEGECSGAVLVARQLGTKHRRWDTLVLECDPDALAARARFGRRHLDADLLRVVRNAPTEWAWYREAIPEPDFPWRYVREAVSSAADRDLIERRRRGGRVEIRRRHPYPDWVRRIVAIENKPDMDASAARDLTAQLEYDVALALADEVWAATSDSDGRAALLTDAPLEAGLLAVDPDARGASAAEVVWAPRRLSVHEPGTRILETPEEPTAACRFEYADPDWKERKRLEIAERAYERGWRSYVDAMRPDCRQFELEPTTTAARPYCRAKNRHQTTRECAGSCPEFEPEPPAWRGRNYPIDGGPGRCVQRLLERQRDRTRPDPEDEQPDGSTDSDSP